MRATAALTGLFASAYGSPSSALIKDGTALLRKSIRYEQSEEDERDGVAGLESLFADAEWEPSSGPTVFITESIPYQQTEIQLTPGARNTWEVLTTFVNEAQVTIDLTAMYWSMLAQNESGGGVFTPEQYLAFGSDKGYDLYWALDAAAGRGVHIRAVCGTGISGTQEIEEIQARHPDNVEFQVWDANDWYGGGIMHQKFWIFDGYRIYLGSANMDWLSLTQVKEMGIAAEGPQGWDLVSDMQKLFDRWWQWTTSGAVPTDLITQFDGSIQQARQTPCWESTNFECPECAVCSNPFPVSTETNSNFFYPMQLELNGTQSTTFVSCSPPAICDYANAVNAMYGKSHFNREWDGNALIRTILSAQSSVSLSVMDYIPSTLYMDQFPPSFWSGLNDALVAKARQGATVQMLISKWASSKPEMWTYLEALAATANACYDTSNPCVGSLEIRMFEVPGWQSTKGSEATFPPYSRVNHAKYIVTDQRFNIGTSNMMWSYFYNTAGTSFNSDHAGLRSQLQAAFDRDWSSSYASACCTDATGKAQSSTAIRV